VWCATLKGWTCTQDGKRIDPLTLSDACSRHLLCCQAVDKSETVRLRVQSTEEGRPGGGPFLPAYLLSLVVYLSSSRCGLVRCTCECAPGTG